MTDNVYVCRSDEIDEEDVLRFDHEGKTYCIYHTPNGFFATDGYCTHEEEHLEDGIVIDNVIECPLHQGRFDVRTGKALSAPACIDLMTYPVSIESNEVYILIDKTPRPSTA
jgi:3-phenylpropionate/trans-cinnamate dioxygenase ferredoxin subunit